jgi:hypothetical protein
VFFLWWKTSDGGGCLRCLDRGKGGVRLIVHLLGRHRGNGCQSKHGGHQMLGSNSWTQALGSR